MACGKARFGLAWCVAAALLVACAGKSAGNAGGSDAAPEHSGCSYEGKRYVDGQSFPASDGCNTCSCDDGNVGCSVTCEPSAVDCEQVVTFYDQLLDEARSCNAHGPNPCTLRVSDGLGCGCETFVNPSHWNAPLAMAFGSHYSGLACNANGNCGPCREPLRGGCTPMGRCEDRYDPPPGRGCKVNGALYPDGASGLPDPTSCNTCTCTDGELSCTTRDCPKACPPGTTLANSCAQCGQGADCDVVEHACQPSCLDVCASGTCVDGACIPDCIRLD